MEALLRYGEVMKDEIVYFELNNWFSGVDYPDEEPFTTWINEDKLSDDDWCKNQRLCVVYFCYDMSVNFLVTARKEWVEKNCPKLLSEHKNYLVEGKKPESKYCSGTGNSIKFLPYKEKNFGCREVVCHWFS